MKCCKSKCWFWYLHNWWWYIPLHTRPVTNEMASRNDINCWSQIADCLQMRREKVWRTSECKHKSVFSRMAQTLCPVHWIMNTYSSVCTLKVIADRASDFNEFPCPMSIPLAKKKRLNCCLDGNNIQSPIHQCGCGGTNQTVQSLIGRFCSCLSKQRWTVSGRNWHAAIAIVCWITHNKWTICECVIVNHSNEHGHDGHVSFSSASTCKRIHAINIELCVVAQLRSGIAHVHFANFNLQIKWMGMTTKMLRQTIGTA